MTRRDDATEAQVRAADPIASTWLSANAGSGKTRVLTDRVARLLLQGAAPERILCLTYTKAAATEMQNRLFQRLGHWTMLDDKTLRQELAELGETDNLAKPQLDAARTLFARAIETPGGLKIQTIHSFCATLLRRFPLEAGVSPQFQEMEDRAATLLRSDVVEMLSAGPDAGLVADLAMGLSDDSFDAITSEILRHRDALSRPVNRAGLCALFGVAGDATQNDISETALSAGDMALLQRLIAVLNASGSNDQKAAAKLAQITQLTHAAIPTLEDVFLSGPKTKTPNAAKIDKLPIKATREAMDPLDLMRLNAWMAAVETARADRVALASVDRTAALYRFAQAFLPAYAAAKLQRGVLDFDDLIDRSRQVLTDPKVAEWVLYRLDGGIDHILVDEAQDTSPEQWDVIDRLALEITSGEGAAQDRARTLFVVGDKKQSIYSFQGADPGGFDRMSDAFGDRLQHSERALERHTLQYSFRSAPVILDLVDATFRGKEPAGFGTDGRHLPFHTEMPGRVDLWPIVPKPDTPEDPPFEDPVDVLRDDDAASVLARRIALELKRMLATGMPIAQKQAGTWGARPMRPGDVLILVQTRNALFDAIIRALKAADIPTAGTDRLKVGAELAVRDMRVCLAVLATPEDDLSLATLLKSPLFGWDEPALYQLAHHRKTPFLWSALRSTPDAAKETAILMDLMGQTDFLRPYDLIERILTRHGGRRKLIARLGAEAEDGINALLSQALAYEQSEIPSLTGFLAWMETDALEIKRQVSQSTNQVRVMSVHGAKGLEAPVVILPDTGPKQNTIRGHILSHDGLALWKPPADEQTPLVREVMDHIQSRQAEERDRLLYVAMTRAEQRLIVCAAGDLGKNEDVWYKAIDRGMTERGAETRMHEFADGATEPVRRIEQGTWAKLAKGPAETVQRNQSLPDWARLAPLSLPSPEVTLSPSDLGGAKALPGEGAQDSETAKRFGSLVHALLEVLPPLDPATWPDVAAQIAGSEGAEYVDDALRHVQITFGAPELSFLFDPKTLVEVPITARLGEAPLFGVIDRLVVTPNHVMAVDFKSNAIVPDTADAVPEGLLRQMGAYSAALAQVYPETPIKTALAWTATGQLLQLPHNMVMAALARGSHLDAPSGHP